MISEQFMQLGRWDLRLSPDTPREIRGLIGNGDQIVVTPNRLPMSDMPALGLGSETYAASLVAIRDTILGAARYRGVILEIRDSKTQLAGHGMLWYLGNSSGSGPFTRTSSVSARTWAQHLAFVDNPPDTALDGWNGLTKVSGVSLPSGTWPTGTATEDELPYSVLQRLTELAGYLEVEFYVDPEGNFRHGGLDALFQTTPQVILMAGHEGRDLDLIGLRLVGLSRTEDYWEQVSDTLAFDTSSGFTGTQNTFGQSIIRAADGNLPWYVASQQYDAQGGTAPTAAADSLQARYGTPHNEVTATVDTYDPGRWMMPGDYLWAYDPINELYDDTEATTYHGMHVTPAKLRLYGMDWSIRQGMGVYRIEKFQGPSGQLVNHPVVVDLTDYVVFEDSPCRLDLGAWQRSYDQ